MTLTLIMTLILTPILTLGFYCISAAAVSGHMFCNMACRLCQYDRKPATSLYHLQLFTIDRKFYNRAQLAQHRRVGDEDDRSYKGHPLCQFCDDRFFDNDDLLRHLRKQHFYCHFCEADGITNEYFR